MNGEKGPRQGLVEHRHSGPERGGKGTREVDRKPAEHGD